MTSALNRQQPLNGNKMIRYIAVILIVCFAFAKANSSILQSYERHKVEQGDTIYKIVNKYNITAEQLMELNPDLKMGLKSGAVLLIPKSNKILTTRTVERYEVHKVNRKETLYTLAKEYGVTVMDIKEANKKLYSESLQKGDKIQIPVFSPSSYSNVSDIGSSPNQKDLPPGKYRVEKSEGRYRVAKKHNISIDILNDLNRDVDELKEGMVLNVPYELEESIKPVIIAPVKKDKEPVVKSKETTKEDKNTNPDGKYREYEVPAKMTMYSLKKMTGLSKDALEDLNPELKEGVRSGMILRLPVNVVKENDRYLVSNKSAKYARLVDSIRNYKNQRIAVMLPFSARGASNGNYSELLKGSRTVRIATDFYSGMMIARDSARTLGITVDYDIYDTGNNENTSVGIIKNNDFKKYNSVIGPLMAKNVTAVARELRDDDIPVVSPLTNVSFGNSENRLYKNLFQARPDDKFLMERLKNYLIGFAKGKNVIIVTDNTEPGLKQQFAPLFPNAKILYPDKKNYISSSKYTGALSKEQKNVVILAANHITFLTGAVSNYAAKARSYDITMVGMNDYDNVSINNMSLAAVNYTFPKMNRNTSSENVFASHYFKKHGITPSEFATRGFDVTMDVILRQASADNLYESAMRNGKTIMVENSFEYNKRFFAGFYNEASYILRFKPDLSIEEVEDYQKN
ncbi:LysM peptidoglycan-binding domain-containing protein [Nonlabens antarcticus]|uniref:LysM peptidoglycan-binding domain-containing protein n=1 Tax=Nonlabens antarcticus TaxID=392714 RepID=UPI001890C796|nr:LysM peptidoglycan-binding domain-containing protein [Nonlabens antarcticus]